MEYDTPETTRVPELLAELWKLLEGGRDAFGQERVFQRAVAMVLGEMFTLGRHTTTQVLRTLGETEGDWSAWYRMFSEKRFKEEQLGAQVLKETLRHATIDELYVVTIDGVNVYRTGTKVAGSSWWLAPDTAPFKRGLRRGQRFVEVAWLIPEEDSYTRAVPLRWLPAPTEKAVPSESEPLKEWEAGVKALKWVREELDRSGREEQRILAVMDGNYDVQDIWKALPERTSLIVRCAKNRVVYALPEPEGEKVGRPKKYGDRELTPREWLHEKEGWTTITLPIRSRIRTLTYRVVGPVVVEGAAGQPLYLIVVKGRGHKVKGKYKYREPIQYLVSAVLQDGEWVLPLPVEILLTWAWQRWECEVGHREMKSALGIGHKQSWGRRSAHAAVQWGVWIYALCVLSAYRCWGMTGNRRRSGRWYTTSHRWSFTVMWQAFREDLWEYSEFRPLFTRTLDKWLKKDVWRLGMSNAVREAALI